MQDYIRITKDVTEFFHDQGITHITIQPEFLKVMTIQKHTQPFSNFLKAFQFLVQLVKLYNGGTSLTILLYKEHNNASIKEDTMVRTG